MMKRYSKFLLVGMICSLLISTNAFAEDEIESGALESFEESTAEDIYESIPETFKESVFENVEESVDAFDDVYEDDIFINPVYDNELNEFSLTKDIETYSMRSKSNPCYYSWSEVVNAVRKAMTSRSTSLTIDYESSETLATGWLKLLLSDVMEETANAVEGDYLESHFGGCKSSRKTSQRNGIYHHQLTLTFTYYTTAEQEAVVTEQVNKLLKSFNFTSSTSDYDKIKTIYDWLTSNVSYDYTNLNNDSYKLKYSAYAALVNRTSVCQGYTGLAYRLLKESGIDARVITGTSSGERHAWLIVKLDGLYYNLDPTWDAQQSAYKYFLRGDNNFSNHYRAAEFLTDSFYQRYPMANSNYSYSKSVTKTKEFVTRLYQVCLGRNPDAGGLETWTKELVSGASTGIGVASGFVFSNEFKSRNLCDEDYVKLLYKALLGREADSTGLGVWVDALKNGKTRESVFNGFATSSEFKKLCGEYNIDLGDAIEEPVYGTIADGKCTVCGKESGVAGFVTRLYRVCLNRDPDQEGLKVWTNSLRERVNTGCDVAYGFVFSNEFKNMNLCNEDYIKLLYKALMGREADVAGLNAWLSALKSGKTRESVFNGFVTSLEFKELCNEYGINCGEAIQEPTYGTVPDGKCVVCGREEGVAGFVTRLYQVCLDRNPDKEGLRVWSHSLKEHVNTGSDVAHGFIFSKEFVNKNLSNEDFVEKLYESFMGRSSDVQGKNVWVKVLAEGKSREYVFDKFVDSQEFTEICNSYGIIRD